MDRDVREFYNFTPMRGHLLSTKTDFLKIFAYPPSTALQNRHHHMSFIYKPQEATKTTKKYIVPAAALGHQ